MDLPWIGLHQLLDPNTLITWGDFSYIVSLIRGPSLGNGQTKTLYDTFGNLVEQAAIAGVWRRATFESSTPPLSKGVGKVLAKAYNGLLDLHGWDQPLDSQDLAMKQPMEHCVRVQPGNLPWPVAVSQEGYPYLLFGKWRHKYKERVLVKGKWELVDKKDEQKIKIAVHRLACWLAHGDPPSQAHECCHACPNKPWCVRPACLRWGTHQENNAHPRATRKRRR